MDDAPPRWVTILGSTGSVGTQALDIVRANSHRLRVHALAARRNVDLLASQAQEFRPCYVALADGSGGESLRQKLQGSGIQVLDGTEGLCTLAAHPETEMVLGAVSGVAGLRPVLAALEAGKILALANKETLVAAGALAMATAARFGASIIPVDSEHSAIFQCMEPSVPVETIILTASGGPFLRRDKATFDTITPAEALRHPNWSMGAKISIDSATMMNKGLEVIEARWLFGLSPEQIQVVIHPQSLIHSMVVFQDGSAKAQLSTPDMRLPIQYAFSYPQRWPAPHGRIDWGTMQRMEFMPPDLEQFPCLGLAFEALRQGGAAPAVLNAANEEAVALFLQEKLAFTGIPVVVDHVMASLNARQADSCDEIVALDADVRRLVRSEATKRNIRHKKL